MQLNRSMRSWMNYGVLLFFVPMLAWTKGPIVGVALLLAGGLYITARDRPALYKADKQFLFLLFLCWFFWLLIGLWHGDSLGSFDLPLRYVLVIPIVLLACKVPISYAWFSGSAAIGAIAAVVVGVWQMQGLGYERALGYTGVIQFGNLSLLMGCFAFAGLFYMPKSTRLIVYILCFLGGLAGCYASYLSGSRGGWLALPTIVLIFAIATLTQNNIKKAAWGSLVALLLVLSLATQSDYIRHRIDFAYSDLAKYEQGDYNTSIGMRLGLWSVLKDMVQERPLLGWSGVEYRERLDEAARLKPALHNSVNLANTHNSFFEVLVSFGVVGLLPFLSLLAFCLFYFLRRLRQGGAEQRFAALCGSVLVSSYIIFSQSQAMFHRNNTLLFFLVTLAVLWGMSRPRSSTLL